MSHRLDLDEIAVLLTDLEMAPQDQRIDVLKSAVINGGGRCDLPSSVPGVYQPVLMSVQVFGVYAMAEGLDELARNWMRGARNILEAADTPEAAA